MMTAPARSRTLAWTVPTAVLAAAATALVALPAEAATAPAARTTHRSLPFGAATRVPAAPTALPAGGSYTIEAGDTLWSIAVRFDTTVAALLTLNGLSRDSVLQPGQVLRLASATAPVSDPTASDSAAYTVVAGDTLWSIAQAHGTTVAALTAANGLGVDAIIYPGQTLRVSRGLAEPAAAAAPAAAPLPSPGETSYTVAPGDTLWAIAAAHGLSLAELHAANGIGPDSIIYPGQQLRLAAAPAPVPVAPSTARAVDTYTAPDVVLSAEQTANARVILQVGRELGVSARGRAIALATAMVESNLRNLPAGDRDSVGLFQQRPSTGWGTAAQIADPAYAARAFFVGAPHTNGLLDIPDWESLGFGDAAQRVQISDYPARYGLWESQATEWASVLG